MLAPRSTGLDRLWRCVVVLLVAFSVARLPPNATLADELGAEVGEAMAEADGELPEAPGSIVGDAHLVQAREAPPGPTARSGPRSELSRRPAGGPHASASARGPPAAG